MKTIYKYTVNQTMYLEMPRNAKILAVQPQKGNICLWAEVETSNDMVKRLIHVVVTGGSVPPSFDYLGTVQLAGGLFVAHIYG